MIKSGPSSIPKLTHGSHPIVDQRVARQHATRLRIVRLNIKLLATEADSILASLDFGRYLLPLS